MCETLRCCAKSGFGVLGGDKIVVVMGKREDGKARRKESGAFEEGSEE